MDQTLDGLWQNSQPPFDGMTLYFEESLDEDLGQRVVQWLIEELDKRVGLAETLLINEDWHVHDGFIKRSNEVSKAQFFNEIRTIPQKWFSVIDYQVYWGVYDASYSYYLRFGHNEDEPVIDLDVSVNEHLIRNLADAATAKFNLVGNVESAKGFFDRIYGG